MPLMAFEWYPEATKAELENSGPMFVTPWRGVLHTTEGGSYAGAYGAYKANRSAPHFTVSFEGSKFRVWQHVPLNRAARALANKGGGVETNRTRCIQIEIVGFAAQSGNFPSAYLDGIARLMRWIEANTGIKRQGPGRAFASAYGQSSLRFNHAEWNSFSGWCGHCHVPENNHWDPGTINIDALLQVSIGVEPMFNPPLNIQVAWWGTDPEGRLLILQPDGAVFGPEGGFYGGMNGNHHFAGRQAAKLIFPGDPLWPAGDTTSKYVIVATSGEKYARP